jgi:hypothetical protein
MSGILNGDVPKRVHCDLETLTTLAVLYGAAIGKLTLMRDMEVFDDFWRQDVDDLIIASGNVRDFILEVIELNEGLDNAINASVH